MTTEERKAAIARLNYEVMALPMRLRIGSIKVEEYQVAVAKLRTELEALKDTPTSPANTR